VQDKYEGTGLIYHPDSKREKCCKDNPDRVGKQAGCRNWTETPDKYNENQNIERY